MIGSTVEVLVEGLSKKSANEFCGRTDTNKMVVFPKNGDSVGDYIGIRIERANSATLFGSKTGHSPSKLAMLTTQEG
jgi:tRNA-2-methylthio-N6-dimethylallyladenosine synthase